MTQFTQDTTPPTRDPNIRGRGEINWDRDNGLGPLGQPDTVHELKVGDQYFEGGCLRTVLAPEKQAAEDRRVRDRLRGNVAAGLQGAIEGLAAQKENLAGIQESLPDLRTAFEATRKNMPADAHAGTVAERAMARKRYMAALDAVDSLEVDIQALDQDVRETRTRLRSL